MSFCLLFQLFQLSQVSNDRRLLNIWRKFQMIPCVTTGSFCFEQKILDKETPMNYARLFFENLSLLDFDQIIRKKRKKREVHTHCFRDNLFFICFFLHLSLFSTN